MHSPITVALIAEDIAHEFFVSAIVRRIAREIGITINTATISGRGGTGTAMTELVAYQRALRDTAISMPQILVIAIDANCKGWNTTSSSITSKIDTQLFPAFCVACPDPHVEKWYLSDGLALQKLYGKVPKLPKGKCVRDVYKNALTEYLVSTDNIVTLGGAEYAMEIVRAMDLYHAGKNDSALKAFIDSVRSGLKLVAQ